MSSRRAEQVVTALGSSMTRIVRSALLAVLATSLTGCVFHRVEVTPVEPADQTSIVGPLKTHLKDGSTVMYAPGVVVTVTRGTLHGPGMRYNDALTEAMPVEDIPLEMVVGMERFATEVNRPASIMASIGLGWLAWSGLVILLLIAGGGT